MLAYANVFIVKGLQLSIIVIYVVALFIDRYPGNPALVSAFFMNIAAYNYGKFHFMRDAEASAYRVALEILEKTVSR